MSPQRASWISRIERNPDHTTVRTLKRIAKALRVDVSTLVINNYRVQNHNGRSAAVASRPLYY